MKRKFTIQNEDVALAAIEDGQKLGLESKLTKNGELFEIAYAGYDCCVEPAKTECQPSFNDLACLQRSFEYELRWMREDVHRLWERFFNHTKGHLPAINDAGKMEGALNALGLGDSFEVEKPKIFVDWN